MKITKKLLCLCSLLLLLNTTYAQKMEVPEEVYECDGCTKSVLKYGGGVLTMKIQGQKFDVNKKYRDDLNCLWNCKELTPRNRYSIADRIAAYFMYHDGNQDSVIKYMEIAFEASPFNFCKTNYKFDDWVQNDPFFKDFYPMYIRMLSEDIWQEKIKQCQECCPETLIIEPYNPVKETPTNLDYYHALRIVPINDQKYRSGYQDSLFTNLQPIFDQRNRDLLDSLYNIYGLPYKEEVTSQGVSALWYVLMHSTDCDWSRKWIDRLLSAYENGITRSTSVQAPLNRLFQYRDNSMYDYEKAFCDDADAFLEEMRQKHGVELAKQLGFD